MKGSITNAHTARSLDVAVIVVSSVGNDANIPGDFVFDFFI